MVKIKLSSELEVIGLPGEIKTSIKKALTFFNPKYIENEKYGRYNEDTPRLIQCYEEFNGRLIIPRGYTGNLMVDLKKLGVEFSLIDLRVSVENKTEGSRKVSLREYQIEAVEAIVKKDFGVLTAPTGSGKTVMACHLIGERKKSTLIIVHTKELLVQWKERIHEFLGVPMDDIGIIGDGKFKVKPITVGMVQTLAKRDLSEISEMFGQVIVDECHRTPCRTFTDVLSKFPSRYQLGLSATPYRSDGLDKLIFFYLGRESFRIDEKKLMSTRQILKPVIVERKTDFSYDYDKKEEYAPLIKALTEDEERNRLIAEDVLSEARMGEFCIVLSDRKKHCELLSNKLRESGIQCETLTGDVKKKDREIIVQKLNNAETKVVIATGQLLGEGFDCKHLSRLFLTVPIKFEGRLKQYIGRILRTSNNKNGAKIYDYIDSRVGILMGSAWKRRKIYREFSF